MPESSARHRHRDRNSRLVRVLLVAALISLSAILGVSDADADVPIDEATHLYDVDASPTDSIVINGITITWAEGGTGTGAVGNPLTGNPHPDDDNQTAISATNRLTIDGNTSELRSYIWTRVSFSEPIAVGNAFAMSDMDGGDNNWELGGIIGFNNGTRVVPTYSLGAQVQAVSRSVVNDPPGFNLGASIPMFRATGNVPNLSATEARGKATADFGSSLVTDVIFIFAVGPTLDTTAQQSSGLSDIGFENIPALAPPTPVPAISLDKTLGSNADSDASGTVSLGDTLTYRFMVTNTGNVTLSPIALTDPLPGLSTPSCPDTTLAAGASTICTATYAVTQGDVDAGKIDNTATVRGTSPAGTTVTATDSVSVPVAQESAIKIDKTPASGTGPVTVGDTIRYDFTITNVGTVTLASVGYSDPTLQISNATCGTGTLAPQQSTTCSATTTVSQAQLEAGEITNTASTIGTPPSGPAVSDTDNARLVLQQSPAIALTKTVELTDDPDDSDSATVGDTLTYTFELSNAGDVALDPVTLSDPKLGLDAISCGGARLAVGGRTTCTATYEVAGGDRAAGAVDNTATVTGKTAVGLTVTATDNVTVPVAETPRPSISVTKLRTGGPDDWVAGDELSYTFTVENTGNTALSDVAVTDSRIDAVSCPDADLVVGASMECTGTYTVTQDDVDAGEVTNTATATGTPPSGPPVEDTATHTDATTPVAGIDLVKRAAGDVIVGTTLRYTFTVTNTGNVTLDDITVTDPLPRISAISCADTDLAPGASTDCSATYAVTQDDVNAGEVTNTATVTAIPPDGLDPPTDDDTATVDGPAATPLVHLDKSVEQTDDADGNGVVSAGDTLTYTFVISNTGDVTLDPVSYDDPRFGIDDAECDGTTRLAPDEQTTCTVTYAVTDDDIADGSIVNTATATGAPPSGDPVTATDTSTVLPPQQPGISLTKTAAARSDIDGSGTGSAGDTIAYTFLVANAGNVPLTGVSVADPAVGAVSCPVDELAVGASTTCTATYTLTQVDIDAGTVQNRATATGSPPGGIDPVQDTSTTTTPLAPAPGISIDKSAPTPDGPSRPGDTVVFTFVITNTGNVTLDPVTYSDPMLGIADAVCGGVSSLAVGASTTCAVSYALTADDLAAGEVDNSADVSGQPPGEAPPVGDADTEIVTVIDEPTPSPTPSTSTTPTTAPTPTASATPTPSSSDAPTPSSDPATTDSTTDASTATETDDSEDTLAETGSDASLGSLVAALLLIGSGAAMLARTRRRPAARR